MALDGERTFVGFGFGAIQAGLFLYEAHRSGNFGRLVVAEVVPEAVVQLSSAGGDYSVNIAHSDRLEAARVGPVEIEDPADEAGRERLVEAVARADEIATAVPSVAFYESGSAGSIHAVLAEGLRRKASAGGPPAVVYAAENNNRAAEILRDKVWSLVSAPERDAAGAKVRFVNTVVGKMSGVVTDADQIAEQGLATVTPGSDRAFLVESFNRILISRIDFDREAGFERGIRAFEEKKDLLPFEEAKLYGHNATHALAAYAGLFRGEELIAGLREATGMMEFLRAAFVTESGRALTRKHAGVDDIFTAEGYAAYADDLLERMTNPFLRDTALRVGRDPRRKLGWSDRLVGTIRVALSQGVEPARYAFGCAAALAAVDSFSAESPPAGAKLLEDIWRAESGGKAPADPDEKKEVLDIVASASVKLRKWREAGFPEPEGLLR